MFMVAGLLCGPWLLLALGHEIRVVRRRGCVGRARDGGGRPGKSERQQCGRDVGARAAYGRRSQSDTSFLQQRPRVPRADGEFGRADPSEEPLPTRARLAAAASLSVTVRGRGRRGRAETPQLCAPRGIRILLGIVEDTPASRRPNPTPLRVRFAERQIGRPLSSRRAHSIGKPETASDRV